jgi:hypothetical protein
MRRQPARLPDQRFYVRLVEAAQPGVGIKIAVAAFTLTEWDVQVKTDAGSFHSSSRAGYARIFIYENVVHLTSFDYTPVDAHQSKSGIAVELRAC